MTRLVDRAPGRLVTNLEPVQVRHARDQGVLLADGASLLVRRRESGADQLGPLRLGRRGRGRWRRGSSRGRGRRRRGRGRRWAEAGWRLPLPEISGPENRGITRSTPADDSGWLSRPGRLTQDRLHTPLILAAQGRQDDVLEYAL